MSRTIFKVDPKKPETTKKILKLLIALGYKVHDKWTEDDYVVNRAVWLYVYENTCVPIGYDSNPSLNDGREYIDLTVGLFEKPDTHITFADGTSVEQSLESWRKLRT